MTTTADALGDVCAVVERAASGGASTWARRFIDPSLLTAPLLTLEKLKLLLLLALLARLTNEIERARLSVPFHATRVVGNDASPRLDSERISPKYLTRERFSPENNSRATSLRVSRVSSPTVKMSVKMAHSSETSWRKSTAEDVTWAGGHSVHFYDLE